MDFEAQLYGILRRICEYYAFKKAGFEVPYETVMQEINAELNALSLKCSAAPALRERWKKTQMPLIFFIDYTIKEGGFSFSGRYQELARSCNELSGDDKFFDLLHEALEEGNETQLLQAFYLFLGLGFDGSYKRERTEVLSLMQEVKGRLNLQAPSVLTTPLCADLAPGQGEQKAEHKPSGRGMRRFLWIAAAAALIAALVNAVSLNLHLSPFEQAIEQAALEARPFAK
ncbi:MAG: DotU family type IV/VI secretion system protein [Proteobacteria bacterium]|uniref:DotU family type IV/VI secretion system protein n=1 Tax=Candidatus Avisuccinivibrio stercorigallinarum TaxID=2840704 RepID=A0A9D9GUJ4_9GAMM|nr:DotU family type IV/VI secretion system protein [Candidatus Avisuccinivibrio stercorigallinarum]